MARASTGSSNRIARIMLCTEPPSMDGGEMTDKGSINQRAVRTARPELVEAIYAETPGPEVFDLPRNGGNA
jgi:feruloyl-CoA synthase